MSSLPSLHPKIKTVVSPFHEMLCSLHVLVQPEHHPRRLQWSQELLKVMPLRLGEGIRRIGGWTDCWTALMDLAGPSGVAMTCHKGMDVLLGLPDAELIHLALNSKAPIGSIIQWMNGARGLEAEELEDAGISLLESLAEFRSLLRDTLAEYEESFFRREWQIVEPWLQTAAAAFQQEAEMSAEKAIASLHPRLNMEKGTITAQKANTYHFAYDSLEHIYVFPSTFIFPHLLIGWYGNDLYLPLAVEIPELPYSESPPADLLLRFKALGDETRLKMVRLLWKGPHCTKQLAPLLGISEAAVSKHLKLLAEARLVKAKRRGSYQFYSADKQEIEMTNVLQRQFLEQ
ncbi:DNA-binding transcriptional ArsR family regulator [Paenibacillus forsythiae]|uniref:DNA-binding transcriptional ArsR family regulator n=1 Tax=Paenibacillus forsythiae TaxID=365616 RepID=A0ABU3H4K1_9BACL|nr:metalloregulator ArsR/SmtB family transcription factor [Paenibacillus forsythiae]MDT3424620.1 DNA-binding transcriptional ArsR family regulator [Paenibacillus forsythiae]